MAALGRKGRVNSSRRGGADATCSVSTASTLSQSAVPSECFDPCYSIDKECHNTAIAVLQKGGLGIVHTKNLHSNNSSS